jgi:23S rRNA pseudouridine1911/1915/1917 synthase
MNRPAQSIRVDKWLKGHYPTLTQRQIEEAVEGGLVLDGDERMLNKGDRLPLDVMLNCSGLDFHLRSLRRGNPRLEVPIVHEASDWLAIDKPAGMPSQPISLYDTDTVTHWAVYRFADLAREFPAIQPTIVPHRLDMGTTGVLIVTKTAAAFGKWRDTFSAKKVQKGYLAWCWGSSPAWTKRHIDLPVGHHPSDRRKMQAVTDERRVKGPIMQAHSEVEVLKADPIRDMVLCAVTCHTGVTHQVRVHLASVGLPLVGDSLYDETLGRRNVAFEHHQLRAAWLASDFGRVEVSIDRFTEGPS